MSSLLDNPRANITTDVKLDKIQDYTSIIDLCAIHTKRQTVFKKDMDLARKSVETATSTTLSNVGGGRYL